MILRLIKSGGPLNYLIFLVTGILFWINSFRAPLTYGFFDGESESILYSPVFQITSRFPVVQVLLSLAIVLFLAFLIQQINSRFALIGARTNLPIIVYIIIIGGFTTMHTLHPVFFSAIFLLVGINSLFSIFNNPNPNADIFNAGFFLAIGTLFYFNLIVILPAFLIAVSILRRERKWSEFFILITGFIIPVLFAVSYAFVTDQLNETSQNFMKSIFTPINHFKTNYPLQGFLALLVFFTITGSFKIIQQYDSQKVSTRKYFLVLFFIFAFSMFSFVFIPATSQEMLVVSALPVTFLISNLFASIQSVFWKELLFTLLLGAAIFMQITEILTFN